MKHLLWKLSVPKILGSMHFRLPSHAHIQSAIVPLFCFVMLFLTLRGYTGNPTSVALNSKYWQDNGPFELSPERGRFALTYSLLEDKSFFYSLPIANFALPDLGYANGHYVSLFAPGISYLIMPGYMIGKWFGSSQLGAYAVIALFAFFNILLIRKIAISLGIQPIAATIGAMVFLFATPAFNYGVTLYQHHVSTFLVLSGLYILFCTQSAWYLSVFWFLCTASIPIDYPNLFLMLPLGILGLSRALTLGVQDHRAKLTFHIIPIVTMLAAILPLLFFLWFNKQSYNNPLQFSGTVSNVKAIGADGKPVQKNPTPTTNLEKTFNAPTTRRSALAFFESRNLLNGLYIHILSPDRGILRFAPIIVFALLGAVFLFKKHPMFTVVITGVMVSDIILYSLWGDPWGGWAFGSRYLIPLYAMASFCIAELISRWRNNIVFILIFCAVLSFSVAVNTAGALTSSANPPLVEVLNLEKLSGVQQRYSYDRNIHSLSLGNSKSFAYQTWFRTRMTAISYYKFLAISIGVVFMLLFMQLYRSKTYEHTA